MISDTLHAEILALNHFLLDCDKQLRMISALYPSNAPAERARFLAAWADGIRQNPTFIYVPLDYDPQALRNRIYALELERRTRTVGLPFAPLLNFERHVLATAEVILCRDTPHFTAASLRAYGRPDAALQATAHAILARPRPQPELQTVDSATLALYVQEKLREYELTQWQVVIREASAAHMSVEPAKREVYIRRDTVLSEGDVTRLLVHEVGTHVLRGENGSRQSLYPVLARGLDGYLATEEGLASYNEALVGYQDAETLRQYALRVLAAHWALERDFCGTFAALLDYLEPPAAFELTLRVKRGMHDCHEPGGFTKDLVYLAGTVTIEAFARQGGDIQALYLGKIGLNDLPMITELLDNRLVQPAAVLPWFYTTPKVKHPPV